VTHIRRQPRPSGAAAATALRQTVEARYRRPWRPCVAYGSSSPRRVTSRSRGIGTRRVGASGVEHQARLRILLDCEFHPLGLLYRHAGHRQAVREHLRPFAVVSGDIPARATSPSRMRRDVQTLSHRGCARLLTLPGLTVPTRKADSAAQPQFRRFGPSGLPPRCGNEAALQEWRDVTLHVGARRAGWHEHERSLLVGASAFPFLDR
jgi:hypothetical protein